MDTIRMTATAKINLALDVLKRRADGYHEVRMIMQMIQLHDHIDLERIPEPGVQLSCSVPALPTGEENIAYRAARRMLETYCPEGGVRIHIDKRIPIAAGMAGGSTDCAAVLEGINILFSLGLSRKQLMQEGLQLGADVPFCLMKQTALAEGIGEVLTPVPPLPDCPIVIARPPLDISTGHVYQSLHLDDQLRHPDVDGMIRALERGSLDEIARHLGNVLESVTLTEHPVIALIKQHILEAGALGTLMSGSGPTVFGLFDDIERARHACKAIEQEGLASHIFLTGPARF